MASNVIPQYETEVKPARTPAVQLSVQFAYDPAISRPRDLLTRVAAGDTPSGCYALNIVAKVTINGQSLNSLDAQMEQIARSFQ